MNILDRFLKKIYKKLYKPLTVAVPEIWNILEIQKMVEKNVRTVLKFQSLL